MLSIILICVYLIIIGIESIHFLAGSVNAISWFIFIFYYLIYLICLYLLILDRKNFLKVVS
jgi:hypothetical protein